MDEMFSPLTSQTNEMRNLIEQMGDIQAKYDAGVIDAFEFTQLKGRRAAFLTVLARNAQGELVSEDEIAELIEIKGAEANLPTQEEQNTADIAYLMMLGGEE